MSPSTDVADREWTVTLDGKPWASAARYEVENPTTGRPLTSAPDFPRPPTTSHDLRRPPLIWSPACRRAPTCSTTPRTAPRLCM